MSVNEELVDLSLFSNSPTNDYRFTSCTPENTYQDNVSRPQNCTNILDKPLPALPPRRVCPGVMMPRNCEIGAEPQCILQKFKRNVTCPRNHGNTLFQRRNPPTAPQLTLSVPQSNPRSRNEASAMIWMEDEQMWLIAEEVEREVLREVQQVGLTGYPSPPEYTPRASSSSAPLPHNLPVNTLTPPLTPLQSQLNSIYQPREEERLSPLFQEAMNSVPLIDISDPYPAPLEPRIHRAYTSPEHPPPIPTSFYSTAPSRSISLGSKLSSVTSRSAKSDSTRGYHSARESIALPKTPTSRGYHSARESTAEDLSQPTQSSRRWNLLARRLASSSSNS